MGILRLRGGRISGRGTGAGAAYAREPRPTPHALTRRPGPYDRCRPNSPRRQPGSCSRRRENAARFGAVVLQASEHGESSAWNSVQSALTATSRLRDDPTRHPRAAAPPLLPDQDQRAPGREVRRHGKSPPTRRRHRRFHQLLRDVESTWQGALIQPPTQSRRRTHPPTATESNARRGDCPSAHPDGRTARNSN